MATLRFRAESPSSGRGRAVQAVERVLDEVNRACALPPFDDDGIAALVSPAARPACPWCWLSAGPLFARAAARGEPGDDGRPRA